MRISDWSSDVCSSDLGFFAGQNRPVHETSAGRVVRQRAMHGAGIGPDQQIADLPFMAIDILRLRGPVAKLREQRAAFLGGPSDDVIGGGAQQQRLDRKSVV